MKFTFAPEATPLAGFRIKRAIDRGGFGEVYYAIADSGKEVALKLLQRNQQIELRGVRQCLNLKHPNLVSIFDIRTDDEGDDWVIMEYVSGPSLDAVLKQFPHGMELAEVERWLAGIAAGVAFLHDRGIVHRDLKPGNVFRENGVVKVGDVGLSKFMTPSRRSAQTESVGTVYYMAPEVSRGKYGRELDVYSLGVMLYEMVTGHLPFDGESIGEILMKHLTEMPDLTPLPDALRPVLSRALEKDPLHRTPDALTLVADFRRALAGEVLPTVIPASNFVDVERLERQHRLPNPRETPVVADQLQTVAVRGPGLRDTVKPPGFWRQFAADLPANPVLLVAVVVACLFVLPVWTLGAGRTGRLRATSTGFVAWIAVGYVAYRIARKHQARTPVRHARRPRPPQPPRVSARFQNTVTAWDAATPPGNRHTPQTLQRDRPAAESKPVPGMPVIPRAATKPAAVRSLTRRQRRTELAGSLTVAVIWAVALSGLIGVVQHYLGEIPGTARLVVDPSHAVVFTLTTIAGAWAVLVPANLFEGSRHNRLVNLLLSVPLGCLVGLCASTLHNLLFLTLPADSAFPGLMTNLGNWPLVASDSAVTTAGFALYFAAFLCLRRGWRQADPLRRQRLSVMSVAASVLVAWLLPAVCRFNQPWGACWATSVSIVVQLSAPWLPAADRQRLCQPAGAGVVKA